MLNAFDCHYSNGFTEGINKKATRKSGF
ncbi:hypothetical protein KQI85_02700 [Falcatimonas sp. MSJ-15]|nr:hypothetical protein [Falcatimonas sp. MSJ-15]